MMSIARAYKLCHRSNEIKIEQHLQSMHSISHNECVHVAWAADADSDFKTRATCFEFDDFRNALFLAYTLQKPINQMISSDGISEKIYLK